MRLWILLLIIVLIATVGFTLSRECKRIEEIENGAEQISLLAAELLIKRGFEEGDRFSYRGSVFTISPIGVIKIN